MKMMKMMMMTSLFGFVVANRAHLSLFVVVVFVGKRVFRLLKLDLSRQTLILCVLVIECLYATTPEVDQYIHRHDK